MPKPKQYDPELALDKAMREFWKRGFKATTIPDLETAMGTNRFAIQTFYGGKDELFIACLDRYLAATAEIVFADLQDGGLEAIEAFFRRISDPKSMPRDAANGCLLVNTLVERVDREKPLVRRRTQRYLRELERLLYEALQLAKRHGELRPELSERECAKFLVTLVLGIQISHRSAGTVRASRDVVTTLEAILSAWRRRPVAKRAPKRLSASGSGERQD